MERLRRAQGRVGFDTEYHGPVLVDSKKKMVNLHRSTLTGFSVYWGWGKEAYYVPMTHKKGNCPPASAREILSALCESEAEVWMHNSKGDLFHLRKFGLNPRKYADSMIFMWLLGRHGYKGKKLSYGLKYLEQEFLGLDRPDFEAVARGRQFNELHPEEALEYAALDAWSPVALVEMFEDEFFELRLDKPFREQEMPCVEVVRHMEDAGMGLDTSRLMELYEELKADLQELEDEWEFLVPDVDIGSAAQVSDHFFPKANGLGGKNIWPIKGVKRGKTRKLKRKDGTYEVLPGRLSVNKDTMELAAAHPKVSHDARAAALVRMEWMGLEKNRSTYTTKLVESALQHEDQRIHSSFHQTGTRTGRFSSSDPNLQNIPVRSDLGKRVKQAFVPRPGFVLLSADYSQIELRVLAHLTGKGYLFEAYQENSDVHQRTADKLGVERDIAKICNFAPIYGAGVNKFSQVSGLPKKEASRIMAELKQVMWAEEELRARIVSHAERRGFVKTATGRLRRLPEFKAHEGRDCQRTPDNWKCEWCYEVSKAKRIAYNLPIQGLAGDIFKRALVAIFRSLEGVEALGTKAFIIAQIHDEVTLEVREDFADEALEIVRRDMEAAYDLRVPLVAEPKIADNWAEAK